MTGNWPSGFLVIFDQNVLVLRVFWPIWPKMTLFREGPKLVILTIFGMNLLILRGFLAKWSKLIILGRSIFGAKLAKMVDFGRWRDPSLGSNYLLFINNFYFYGGDSFPGFKEKGEGWLRGNLLTSGTWAKFRPKWAFLRPILADFWPRKGAKIRFKVDFWRVLWGLRVSRTETL